MRRIELIYFEDCPNAPAARDRVREAIRVTGVSADLTEWEQGNPAAPAHVREYGSPTVLVDGQDVTGLGPGVAASACRADGAPSVEAIERALRTAT